MLKYNILYFELGSYSKDLNQQLVAGVFLNTIFHYYAVGISTFSNLLALLNCMVIAAAFHLFARNRIGTMCASCCLEWQHTYTQISYKQQDRSFLF